MVQEAEKTFVNKSVTVVIKQLWMQHVDFRFVYIYCVFILLNRQERKKKVAHSFESHGKPDYKEHPI